MKTDRYTKTVLTIIAACLVILVFKSTPLSTPVHAQSQGEMQGAISFCWDLAKIRKVTDSEWQIHTYC